VQLLAGGTLLAEDDNTNPPAVDTFVSVTVNYSYNAGLHAALVGQPLEIRLLSKNLVGGTSEVEFDDVQLSVTLGNPLAIPGGPYTVFIGGSLLLNGNASIPSGNATITSWEWDLDNDGDFDENITGATPTAISQEDLVNVHGMSLGSNTIKLRVTDSDTKTAIAETTVNILPATAVVYEPFAYTGTALAGQSGSTEVGLTGVWTSNTNPTLFSNLGFSSLVTRGAGIGNLGGGSNTFGGARAISASALSGNGLLQDGATLWFSVIMGYDSGGNRTNSRLVFVLGSESMSTGNNSYFFPTAGATGLGVTLGRFSGVNGRIVATQVRDSTFGTGFSGNVFGTGQTTNVLPSATNTNVDSTLVVGRITWGAVSDTIDLFLPGPDLALPVNPHSTLTVNVNQSDYDTITWSRGDRVVMDEIRFGGSYSAVVETGSAWDLNGTTAGSGGPTPSGTWDNTTSNWNVAPDGTLAPVPWTPGGVATFSAGTDATGDYTITVDGTRDISGIVFEDGTTSVTGGTALRLTGNATLTVGSGRTATINTPLSEDAAGREMSKGGGGTLVLTADNSALTGTTSLNGGVARFDALSAIPGTARNLAINANGTALFGPSFGEANIATAMVNRIAAASAGTIAADNYATTDFDFNTAALTAASLGAVGPVSYTGTLTPQGTTYRLGGGGGTLTMANADALTGPSSLVVNGAGTVVLAEDNSYSGATTVGNGATLRMLGATSTSSVTVNQIGGVLEVGHASALGSGPLTFGGGFATAPTIRPIGTVTASNSVTANGGFNIEGTGTLGLGTLTLANNIIINNLNTTNPTTFAAITAAGGVRTLSLTGNGSTTVTGAIGGGTGVSNITKGGSGTLTLGGVNTYTGTMTVNDAGTLRVLSPG
jgi:autotransporter-associated beta strand protein